MWHGERLAKEICWKCPHTLIPGISVFPTPSKKHDGDSIETIRRGESEAENESENVISVISIKNKSCCALVVAALLSSSSSLLPRNPEYHSHQSGPKLHNGSGIWSENEPQWKESGYHFTLRCASSTLMMFLLFWAVVIRLLHPFHTPESTGEPGTTLQPHCVPSRSDERNPLCGSVTALHRLKTDQPITLNLARSSLREAKNA